jgi:hypothetical protein
MEMYDNYNEFHDWIMEEEPMYRNILTVQDSQVYQEMTEDEEKRYLDYSTTGLLESQLMNIHLYIDYFNNESERCPHRSGKYACVKDGELNMGICSWNKCPLSEGKDWNNGENSD